MVTPCGPDRQQEGTQPPAFNVPAVPPHAVRIILHPEIDARPLRQLHPQIDARDVFLSDKAIRHDPCLRHPPDRPVLRPGCAVNGPERSIFKKIQLVADPRKLACVRAVLPVPQTLARVVDEQRPAVRRILHADEVFPAHTARGRVGIQHRAEAAADLLRQAPVVHAHAHARLVIQPVVHHHEALA